jgi:hypothetical protein
VEAPRANHRVHSRVEAKGLANTDQNGDANGDLGLSGASHPQLFPKHTAPSPNLDAVDVCDQTGKGLLQRTRVEAQRSGPSYQECRRCQHNFYNRLGTLAGAENIAGLLDKSDAHGGILSHGTTPASSG